MHLPGDASDEGHGATLDIKKRTAFTYASFNRRTGATRSGVQKYQHKDKGNASQEASAFTERFSTAVKHTK